MHEYIAAVAAALEKHRDLVTGFKVRYETPVTVVLTAGRHHYAFALEQNTFLPHEVAYYLVEPAIRNLRLAAGVA